MGLFGGIISGAMSGAGTAGLQQQDTQQKLQGGLYNAEQLAQMNADLDVQKQASLMRLQQEMRLNALSDPRLNGGSQSVQSTPAQPVAPTSASIDPVIGNAISDMPKNGALSTLPPLPTPTSAYDGGKILPPIPMPTPTGGITYPVPDAVSGLKQRAPTNQASNATPIQPAIWQPSHELQLAAYRADIANPGAGAKILEANAPDATGKMLLAQGIAPGSQEWISAYKAASIKATGESLRGGNTLVVGGRPVFSAPDASGNQIIYDNQGNPSIQRVAGANDAEAQAAASKLSGTNSQTIAPSDARPVDAQGRPIPVSISAALNNGSSAQGAGNVPGIITGKEGQQKSLNDKWSALNTQNQQAQTTTSYLQNIKGLAAKAAVGPMSDRIDFANGLLSILPDATGNKKNATDAVTANDLLDKYQGQIIARLGQGGMGTDSARALLASAYPGSHMNLPAINEAVDNLVGANDMVKAKAALLAPHAANLDPVTYQEKELKFDQNADPRIWQWMNIQDQAQKKAFAASILKQDPNFPSKIDVLEKIGAL